MKNKVNLNEGLESLERILLMMNYDNKKTLSENHNILSEQISQTQKKDIISKYFKGNKNFEKLFQLQHATDEKLNFESSYEGEGPTIFYSPSSGKVYRFFLSQVEKGGKNTINFMGPNGSGVGTIDTTNNRINLIYNNKSTSETLNFVTQVIDRTKDNKLGSVSQNEILSQEKIWGEKIPDDKKTGQGIVEWQNKLSYDILRSVETMKGQRGWTGVGGKGLLRAEGSDVDIKCEVGKYTISGSLNGDIQQNKICVNPFNDETNALYKPYNPNINYTNILTSQIMSIQDANYENLKGKILQLLNSIPQSPTMGGKIRSEDIHTILLLPQIILPFLGPVGLVTSVGLAAFDAYIYYKDGDYTGAALALIFGALDLGWLGAELKIAKVSKEESKIIIDAVKNNKVENLTVEQQNILEKIAKNSDEITDDIAKNMEREATSNPEFKKFENDVYNAVVKSKQGKKYVAGQIGTYAGAYGSVEGTKKITDIGSPKGVVEKTECGYDSGKQKTIYCNWEVTKQIFGSSGSEKDNLLLRDAITKGGWIPYKQDEIDGEIIPNPIPSQYQSQAYKKEQEQFATKLVDMMKSGKDGEKKEFNLPTYTDEERNSKLDSLTRGEIKFSKEELEKAFD